MSYTTELLPGEPILIETLNEDFDFRVEGPAGSAEMLRILDEQTRPIYLIIDMSRVNMSFDDMLAGASTATQQLNIFKHRNVEESIVVTQSRMIQLSSKGLNSPIFGNLKFRAFNTLEEALEHARSSDSMRDAM